MNEIMEKRIKVKDADEAECLGWAVYWCGEYQPSCGPSFEWSDSAICDTRAEAEALYAEVEPVARWEYEAIRIDERNLELWEVERGADFSWEREGNCAADLLDNYDEALRFESRLCRVKLAGGRVLEIVRVLRESSIGRNEAMRRGLI